MEFNRKLIMAGILLAAAGFYALSGAAASGRIPEGSSLTPAAALGKKIFFDRSLSASGKLACSTCHDPRYAYGPPNGFAVE